MISYHTIFMNQNLGLQTASTILNLCELNQIKFKLIIRNAGLFP